MSAFVFTVRPEPGCSTTVEGGRAAGLPIEGCPLFDTRPLAWEPPMPAKVDALLLGSANAVRHAGPGLVLFLDKPAYVVGAATARKAATAGLAVAGTGRGGLQDVLDTLDPPLRLLRLAGAERVALAPPPGVVMETRTVYESVPRPLPDEIVARLRDGGLVLLHSALAARHFADECDRRGVSRDAVAIAALGPRIAAAAGKGWLRICSAPEPDEAALLALARDMCHDIAL